MGEVKSFDFLVPTKIVVPAKAEAGIVPDTVSGVVNLVATEIQFIPFQYAMILELLKLGLEMAMSPKTSEFKAPTFGTT